MARAAVNDDYRSYDEREPDEVLASVESEAALLGAMMMNADVFDRLADEIDETDFHEDVHARMFSAIRRLAESGQQTNPIMVAPLLQDDPAFASLGGSAYLFKLTGSPLAILGAKDFARQIRALAKRRRLRAELVEVMADVQQPAGASVVELIERIDAALNDTMRESARTRSSTIAKAFDATMLAIEAEAAGETSRGVQIAGFDDWNKLTGGMRAGEVTVLAARPAMGKTACALSIAIGAARAGHGTLIVSLEMGLEELTKRAISDLCFQQAGDMTFDTVKRGTFNTFDRRRLVEVRDEIESWPLILTDPSQLKIGRLAMQIRRYQRQVAAKGATLDLIVLDYLGLIKTDDPKQSRYQGVGEISRAIKEVAKECGVAVLLLAQLNRKCEEREDKRPQLADLRDSGDIEQDADTVAFLYRDQYYLEQNEPPQGDKRRPQWEIDRDASVNRLEVIVAKRRNGRTGKRVCWFFGEHQAVRNSDFYSAGGVA